MGDGTRIGAASKRNDFATEISRVAPEPHFRLTKCNSDAYRQFPLSGDPRCTRANERRLDEWTILNQPSSSHSIRWMPWTSFSANRARICAYPSTPAW
jgi:hypothetical protein